MGQIQYSEKYFDDTFEYRHVVLPPEVAKLLPKNRLLSENEWRAIGVQQSRGWVHYAIHRPEPHIMLFRRPLNYQQQQESQAQQIAIANRRQIKIDRTKLVSDHKSFCTSVLMSRKRNAIVASGLLIFAGAGLAFPFYMASRSSKTKPVIDSSKALPPQATFRGPYINTGSRDIGPDDRTYPKK
ncbi:OLC1v1003756C1 [Oldenlandia corymbosa var. corymbosa]|nr:OLC1v1003756C1 [Oldenlandia corymbosa var. corymbosa]